MSEETVKYDVMKSEYENRRALHPKYKEPSKSLRHARWDDLVVLEVPRIFSEFRCMRGFTELSHEEKLSLYHQLKGFFETLDQTHPYRVDYKVIENVPSNHEIYNRRLFKRIQCFVYIHNSLQRIEIIVDAASSSRLIDSPIESITVVDSNTLRESMNPNEHLIKAIEKYISR